MKYFFLISFLFPLLAFNQSQKGKLILEIEGINDLQGNIALLVFNGEEGFPDKSENAIIVKEIKITKKEVFVDLGELAYGKYAVSLIHDVNANKELDKNFFGIPKEPFGFSNTKHIYFGLPNFEQATIVLNEKMKEATISLINI